MSPLALIAGIPRGLYTRAREKPACHGWQVQVIPSEHQRKADLRSIWKRVMHHADDSDADGVHLILAHHRDDERSEFERMVCRSHRVIWIPRELLRSYGTEVFQREISAALQFEDGWRVRIRPTIDSPLLLPETAFSASGPVVDMWRRAMKVRRGRDGLDAVQKVVGRFKHHHRKETIWRDSRELDFRRGPSHGGRHLPKRRRRKLTFNLPDGFHFDVRHRAGRPFHVSDEAGTTRRFTEYTNIDPHGFVRGGR